MSMTKAVSSPKIEVALVTGNSANTPLACTSAQSVAIATTDEIVFAVELATSTNAHTDRTSTMSIPSAGYVQSTTDTSSDKLLVMWMAKSSTTAYSHGDLRMNVIAADTSASVDEVLADITTDDTIIACYTVDGTSGALTDITSTVECSTDGTLHISPGTAHGILIFWWDVSGNSGAGTFSALCPVMMLATGAGANSNITVTGITTSDELLAVMEFHGTDYTTVADRLSTSSITSAGNIQCTSSTSGNKVWVLWHDTSA